MPVWIWRPLRGPGRRSRRALVHGLAATCRWAWPPKRSRRRAVAGWVGYAVLGFSASGRAASCPGLPAIPIMLARHPDHEQYAPTPRHGWCGGRGTRDSPVIQPASGCIDRSLRVAQGTLAKGHSRATISRPISHSVAPMQVLHGPRGMGCGLRATSGADRSHATAERRTGRMRATDRTRKTHATVGRGGALLGQRRDPDPPARCPPRRPAGFSAYATGSLARWPSPDVPDLSISTRPSRASASSATVTAASSCAPIGPSILVQPSPSTKRR